jgi:hypothetical protein
MLEYRRSYEEEARRADALEAQRRVLEASVQAVEVCWTQVSIDPHCILLGNDGLTPRLAGQCRAGSRWETRKRDQGRASPGT